MARYSGACLSSQLWGSTNRITVHADPGIKRNTISKITAKRAGRVAQVVPSKCKAPSSTPQYHIKKFHAAIYRTRWHFTLMPHCPHNSWSPPISSIFIAIQFCSFSMLLTTVQSLVQMHSQSQGRSLKLQPFRAPAGVRKRLPR
jgi:hypothetical protein